MYIAGTDDAHFKRSPRVGYAVLDPVTGASVQTGMLPGQGSKWSSTLVSFFSLHFGSYGGVPVRVLYAVLGVMGALLFYTGNVLWIESRTKRLRGGDLAAPVPRHVRWVSGHQPVAGTGAVARKLAQTRRAWPVVYRRLLGHWRRPAGLAVPAHPAPPARKHGSAGRPVASSLSKPTPVSQ